MHIDVNIRQKGSDWLVNVGDGPATVLPTRASAELFIGDRILALAEAAMGPATADQ